MFLLILFLIVTILVFILFRKKEVLSEQYNHTQKVTVNLDELVTTQNDDEFEFFVHSYLTDFFTDPNKTKSSKTKLNIAELLNLRMNYLNEILEKETFLKNQSEEQLFESLFAIVAFLKKSSRNKTRKYFKAKSKIIVEGIKYSYSINKPLYIFFIPLNPHRTNDGTYFDVLTNLIFVEAYEYLSDKNKSEIEDLFSKMAHTRMELREHILNVLAITSRIDRLNNFKEKNQTLIDACG